MPGSVVTISTWSRIVDSAITRIKDEFVGWMGDSFKLPKECPEIDKKSLPETGVHVYTLYLYRTNFWRVRTPFRNVLRITDFGESKDAIYRINNGIFVEANYIIPYDGLEPLKCELFWDHPRLRQIVRHVLEPLAKELGYKSVDYVDVSDDRSAWYPDEYRELPQARLLGK